MDKKESLIVSDLICSVYDLLEEAGDHMVVVRTQVDESLDFEKTVQAITEIKTQIESAIFKMDHFSNIVGALKK